MKLVLFLKEVKFGRVAISSGNEFHCLSVHGEIIGKQGTLKFYQEYGLFGFF